MPRLNYVLHQELDGLAFVRVDDASFVEGFEALAGEGAVQVQEDLLGRGGREGRREGKESVGICWCCRVMICLLKPGGGGRRGGGGAADDVGRGAGLARADRQPADGAPILVLDLLLKHATPHPIPSIPLLPEGLGVRGGAKDQADSNDAILLHLRKRPLPPSHPSSLLLPRTSTTTLAVHREGTAAAPSGVGGRGGRGMIIEVKTGGVETE